MGPEKSSLYHRRSIRLPDVDYSAEGGYFVTLVTHQRECLFGKIVNGVMQLSDFGRIARDEWFRTKELRPNVELLKDEFVVMPNHIHGIIWLFVDGNSCDKDAKTVKPSIEKGMIPNGCGKGDLQVALTRPKGPQSGSIGAIIAG